MKKRSTRFAALFLILAMFAAALAGCGDGGSGSAESGGEGLSLIHI